MTAKLGCLQEIKDGIPVHEEEEDGGGWSWNNIMTAKEGRRDRHGPNHPTKLAPSALHPERREREERSRSEGGSAKRGNKQQTMQRQKQRVVAFWPQAIGRRRPNTERGGPFDRMEKKAQAGEGENSPLFLALSLCAAAPYIKG